MSLQQQIQDDMKAAMKARDTMTRDSLRLAISSLKNRAVQEGLGPQGELSDEIVIGVLTTEVKRRREAAEGFEAGGRPESAEQERAEQAVYERYLPAQLTDDELATIVDAAVAEVGATSPKEMGLVMKAAMAQVGKQADGSRVQALAKARLIG